LVTSEKAMLVSKGNDERVDARNRSSRIPAGGTPTRFDTRRPSMLPLRRASLSGGRSSSRLLPIKRCIAIRSSPRVVGPLVRRHRFRLASSSSSSTDASTTFTSANSADNNNGNVNGNSNRNDNETKRCISALDHDAVTDLFAQHAQSRDGRFTLNCDDIRKLIKSCSGQVIDDKSMRRLFAVADSDNNGLIDHDEFMENAYLFLGDNPASIILVIGGPGSGKGVLSERLTTACNVVHLSSGELLRNEVQEQTRLGRTVEQIMLRGELVSSAIMVALMKKRMENHPGKRVLLDGFPRSLENAHDLVTLCGRPELALHLTCDDTILMERIMSRRRGPDDDFHIALNRLRTFHKYHPLTMDWLREQHVPIVNLDCGGTSEHVWQQLLAIGRLMRPAVKLPNMSAVGSGASSTGGGIFSSLVEPEPTKRTTVA
jgi:adenylate kinase